MFVVQSNAKGEYRVVNTRTWDWDDFGTDRIGALDHCDRQNRAYERACRYAV